MGEPDKSAPPVLLLDRVYMVPEDVGIKEGDLVIAITRTRFFTDKPVARMTQAQANGICVARVAQIHYRDGSVRLEKPGESDYIHHNIDPGSSSGFIFPDCLVEVEHAPDHVPIDGMPKKNEKVLIKLTDGKFVQGVVLSADSDTRLSAVIVRSRSGDEAIFRAITQELYRPIHESAPES